MTGELGRMLADLIDTLGGEQQNATPQAVAA
jgi:DNA recombination-dependent growth factor C